jgi:short-subunit dehydrogenase
MNLHELKKHYGPVALVTGASSGIGEQFAEVLAEVGFDLVLVARRRDLLNTLSARLAEKFSTTTTIVEADLTDAASIDQIMEHCEGLDIGLLVSNAGFGLKGLHQHNDPSQLLDMLMVNCQAPMQLTHRFIPGLRQRQRAGVILTSSVEALMGYPYSAAYAASKAFVSNLAEGLWGELSTEGVDVCAICPGSTDTPAHDLQGIDRSKIDEYMAPREVAELALTHIEDGPVYIVGEKNEHRARALAKMPRRESLPLVREAMKQVLLK